MRLSKRGRIWHGGVFEPSVGRVVWRTTRQHDRAAAATIVAGWERDAADPDHARKAGATLSDAIKGMLANVNAAATAGKRSLETPDFYKRKAGHLIRLLEGGENYRPLPLQRLDAPMVDSYIAARRAEWSVAPKPERVTPGRRGAGGPFTIPAEPGRHVTDSTIHKELVALRLALKWAKRAGLWSGEIDALLPSFSPEYKPRKRFLDADQINQLFAKLTSDDAARVAFITATSAEWGATKRAERDDIAGDDVFLRGTKRSTRERTVPVVLPLQRSLLAYALEHAQGKAPLLFKESYAHFQQALARAAVQLGFGRISANDLRRSCSTWLRAAGVPDELNACVLGHADTRMVARVYGQMPLATLRARLSSVLDCDAGVVRGSTLNDAGVVPGAEPAMQTTDMSGYKVPGTGIEPVTRGFSVPTRILASPRDDKRRGRRSRPTAMPASKTKR